VDALLQDEVCNTSLEWSPLSRLPDASTKSVRSLKLAHGLSHCSSSSALLLDTAREAPAQSETHMPCQHALCSCSSFVNEKTIEQESKRTNRARSRRRDAVGRKNLQGNRGKIERLVHEAYTRCQMAATLASITLERKDT
jgi:hypothetical protein